MGQLVIGALPGVHVKLTVTGESFQPAAFSVGETEAVMTGGPGAVTLILARNVRPLAETEIAAVPVLTAVTKPVELTVAMFDAEELQDELEVIFCELPSE